jgi:hypothetical protein
MPGAADGYERNPDGRLNHKTLKIRGNDVTGVILNIFFLNCCCRAKIPSHADSAILADSIVSIPYLYENTGVRRGNTEEKR